MKSIALFIITFLFSSLAFGQWTSVNSGVGENLQRIQFTTSNIGYAAGYSSSGVIIRTNDQGNNWDTVFSSAELVTDLSFGTVMEGRAVTSGSHILKSIAPGTSWGTVLSTFPPPVAVTIPAANVTAFQFINSTTGFAGDDSGNVYKTTNGGVTWSNGTFIGVTSVLESFTFLSNNTGIVVGHDNGVIAKTTDGGNTWTVISQAYNLKGVDSHSANVVFAAGTNNTIVKSTDHGNTWSPLTVTGSSVNFNAVFCATNNVCYVVGDNGTIVKTVDGGLNWQYQNSGTLINLNSITGTSPDNCYASGDNGVILKTTNGGSRLDETKVSEDGFLIYPNPASDVLNFFFYENCNHYIRISDAVGQLILSTETQQQELQLNVSELPEGIYFIEIKTPERVLIRKWVVQ